MQCVTITECTFERKNTTTKNLNRRAYFRTEIRTQTYKIRNISGDYSIEAIRGAIQNSSSVRIYFQGNVQLLLLKSRTITFSC
jgi:hypothetical protein